MMKHSFRYRTALLNALAASLLIMSQATTPLAQSADDDGDGVANDLEIARGTDPFDADTDNDGVSDGQDAFPLDPTRSDEPGNTPALLRDINTASASSNPQHTVKIDGVVFFAAFHPEYGTELWRTDGTAAGTTLVSDILPGRGSSNPVSLTNVGGMLFFGASNPAIGTELWVSDGTAQGTVLVKDIYVGNGSSNPQNLIDVSGTLFFTAGDAASGYELWRSNGTAAGTVLVKDIRPGSSHSFPRYLTEMNGTLFFTANDGIYGDELWRSDGTTAGTALVSDISPGAVGGNPNFITNVNGLLFFYAYDALTGTELWRSDGTEAGTVLVKDIWSGADSSLPLLLTDVNGTLFFIATDGINGRELWRSDGTAIGTVLVKDIFPGAGQSSAANLTNVDGTLFFRAIDGPIGPELWRSDGTAAGTVLVKDIYPGSGNSTPAALTAVNGTLFFTAFDGVNGVELWRSDGTAAGTVLVKDISPGPGYSSPSALVNANGTLIFAASSVVTGTELWRSDGTQAGTVLVADIHTGTEGSSPFQSIVIDGVTWPEFVEAGGVTFFAATTPSTGTELWRTDATTTGTVLLKDIFPGGSSSNPQWLVNVNGTLFFTASDANGYELWRSDGTQTGTYRVKDIWPGASSSSPQYLTNVNGTLFFAAFGGAAGLELWRSDGTEAGTVQVKDIWVGSNSSNPHRFINVNGTLFFDAIDSINGSDTAHGYELWRSDGTEAGTVLVKDIRPTGDSTPRYLTKVNDMLFFNAFTDDAGWELWRSDGTEAGTIRLKDILPGTGGSNPVNLVNLDGTLFFSATDGINGQELWRSDGTAAGTVLVKDIWSGAGSAFPQWLTTVNGALFFNASDGVNGQELWRSDGTASGTVLVKDIWPGSTGSGAGRFVNVNGSLYFLAADAENGTELWRSNGTAAGTVLLTDILPGPDSSFLQSLQNTNGRLFFRADDGFVGNEPWVFTPAPNTAPTAVAGPDQAIECAASAGTVVTLDGSLTSDTEADALTFEWRNASGTVIGTTANIDVTLPVGTHTFTLNVDDGQGGIATDNVVVTVSDTTSPSFSTVPAPMAVGQTAAGGTAVVVPMPVAIDACDASFTLVSNEPPTFPVGDTVVTFTATDASGNSATASTTVTVVADEAAPSTTVSLAPLPNAAGWHNTDVTVGLGATDNAGGSGVASIAYGATGAETIDSTTVNGALVSFAISIEGTSVINFSATDVVGNVEAPQSLTIRVDRTAPSITSSTDGASFALGQAATASFGCTDSGSGIDLCASAVAHASPLDTSTAGTKSFTVTATDVAGNTASETVEYTVTRGVPQLTWPSPASITYGTALDDTQLNASADVAGTFTYEPAAGTMLGAGTHTLSVTFTPADAANYDPATATVTVVVAKGTPVVTWGAPAAMLQGTALGDAQLNATSSVPGAIAYTPAAGTMLDVGTHTLTARFTPSDAANYETVDTTVALTVGQPGASADSVTPATGSGSSATFALRYSDWDGASNLSRVWVWFHDGPWTSSSANSCMAYYDVPTNRLNLLNDAATAWTPGTLGTATTLQSSQCAVSLGSSSVVVSGNVLTLNLAVTFKPGFLGSKNIYMYAANATGNSGWKDRGDWTLDAPVVTTNVVTPSAGTGTTQMFALEYGDTFGAADLRTVWVWFHDGAWTSSSANSCMAYYDVSTNTLNLLNDAATGWTPATIGATTILQSSQCAVSVGSSSVNVSGNILTLNLAVTFKAGFTGAKNIYMWAGNPSGHTSGWQDRGDWTVPTPPTPVLTADAVAPNTGTGETQTFALEYGDTVGATDLRTVWVWFHGGPVTSSSANSCMAYYDVPTNTLNLLNDAATGWMAATLGTATTLQSSQCAVSVGSSSAVVSGNVLTLNLAVTFKSGFTGSKNVYMWAGNTSGDTSGWQDRGDWTVPAPTTAVVTTNMVTPNRGSGETQTFALQYGDASGAANLRTVWVWFHGGSVTSSSAGSCMARYDMATNTLNLLNDAATAWTPATLGAPTTLRSSQCDVLLESSSVVVSGNVLTLNLAVRFSPGFSGWKNIYMWADNATGSNSGWRDQGDWTLP